MRPQLFFAEQLLQRGKAKLILHTSILRGGGLAQFFSWTFCHPGTRLEVRGFGNLDVSRGTEQLSRECGRCFKKESDAIL